MRRLLATLTTTILAGSLALVAAPAHAEDPEDLTPPVIQITPMAGGVGGWYGGTATVFVKATDPGPVSSGVRFVSYTMTGATTGTGTVHRTDGGTLTISNGGRTTITIEAEDGNGNSAFDQVQIGVDRDQPTITFAGRLADVPRVFAQGEQVLVEFSCADALSGVESCTGTQAAGAWLDTSTIGNRVVTVFAEDRIGNQNLFGHGYTVVSDQFEVTQGVDISSTPVVGKEVSVVPPVFDPVPTTIAYQWLRNGAAIPGATAATYVLTPDDAGAALRVRGTATRSGWQDGVTTSPAYEVQPAPITISGIPMLAGEATLGGSLRVALATVTPDTATLSYQWYRDEVLIPDAQGSVYSPQPLDLGKRISAQVHATAPGHLETVWDIAPSDVVRGRKLAVNGVPTVSGTMRAGSVLTVQAPSVRVPPISRAGEYGEPATVAYQWLSDGAPISGATQSTYRLTAADVGRRVTVRTTSTRPPEEGYEPVVLVSVPGPAVGQATPAVTGKAKAKGQQKVKLTVSVSVAGLDPSASVTVKRGKKVVARGKVTSSGRLVLRLKRQPRGKVTWTVLYAGSRGVAASSIRVAAKVR